MTFSQSDSTSNTAQLLQSPWSQWGRTGFGEDGTHTTPSRASTREQPEAAPFAVAIPHDVAVVVSLHRAAEDRGCGSSETPTVPDP